MKRVFQIKWYHIVIALAGVLAVALVLVWIFMAKGGPSGFFEDETDIVS
jgi:hypothetical protein